MDNFQTRPTADDSRTVTPRQAIARVQELASANYGPLGVINFEFIPLAEAAHEEANWDLAFRPSPSDAHAANERRLRAIQRAVEQVRSAYPKVRWP